MKNICFKFVFFILLIPTYSFSQVIDSLNLNLPKSTVLDSVPDIINGIERSAQRFSVIDNGIKIYPNPTEGELNIDYEFATGHETIEILDLLGLKVLELPLQKSIDLSALIRGIYFLRLLDKNNRLIVMERIIRK